MSVKGTRTEQNLIEAFEDEALARCKYSIYANAARAEGFETAARVLDDFANNENEHAKLWLRLVNDGKLPSTEFNLKNALEFEKKQWTDKYLQYAEDARQDNFEHIAGLFEKVADIEKHHAEVMERLLLMLNESEVLPDANGNFSYMCSECGCIIEQKERPDYCPLCNEPTVFFFKIKR